MVTMVAERPVTAMTMRRARPDDSQIRTNDVPKPAAKPARTRPAPVRLTRRGRIVVTAVSALIIAVASVLLATSAQATRGSGAAAPGKAATPGKYVTKVVVRPGQSLWTVAETNDPNADTRRVIADIESMNSMSGDQLQPGETLWVPRG